LKFCSPSGSGKGQAAQTLSSSKWQRLPPVGLSLGSACPEITG
jgi:hypothetical protein